MKVMGYVLQGIGGLMLFAFFLTDCRFGGSVYNQLPNFSPANLITWGVGLAGAGVLMAGRKLVADNSRTRAESPDRQAKRIAKMERLVQEGAAKRAAEDRRLAKRGVTIVMEPDGRMRRIAPPEDSESKP